MERSDNGVISLRPKTATVNYEIICRLDGNNFVIVQYDGIDYLMPYAYLPTVFTDLVVYFKLIDDNIYAVIRALKAMVLKETWRHPELDDIFGIPAKTKR